MEILKPLQVQIISKLINNYHFDIPLHVYFKQEAKLNKNWGSRDRKLYRKFLFQYFRLGSLINNFENTEKVIVFLSQQDEITRINSDNLFSHPEWVSELIDFKNWQNGLLFQRPVYVVLNQTYLKEVLNYFKSQNIESININKQIVQLPPDTPIHELEQKGWLWIMDIASYQTIQKVEIAPQNKVWDCCSGAGGKSIYLRHQFGNQFSLTVSDVRSSILENLKKRFAKLNFKLPDIKLLDLTIEILSEQSFDVIIADVPCSGSGTWGRNPENITQINEQGVLKYSNLQKRIVSNAILSLNKGGLLYYMTCSVFKEENENNVAYFKTELGLELMNLSYQYLNYQESDILFIAVLRKN